MPAGNHTWEPIRTAPSDTIVVVFTKGGQSVLAVYTDFEAGTKAWQAVREDQHPKCWSNGVCWDERNADGDPSDPPQWWVMPPAGWDE
jgi:hypothetical protein